MNRNCHLNPSIIPTIPHPYFFSLLPMERIGPSSKNYSRNMYFPKPSPSNPLRSSNVGTATAYKPTLKPSLTPSNAYGLLRRPGDYPCTIRATARWSWSTDHGCCRAAYFYSSAELPKSTNASDLNQANYQIPHLPNLFEFHVLTWLQSNDGDGSCKVG